MGKHLQLLLGVFAPLRRCGCVALRMRQYRKTGHQGSQYVVQPHADAILCDIHGGNKALVKAGRPNKHILRTCASAAMAAAVATFCSAASRRSLSRATCAAALSASARRRPNSTSSSLTYRNAAHGRAERAKQQNERIFGVSNNFFNVPVFSFSLDRWPPCSLT